MSVEDAWTCPAEGCGRTYWPPAIWEPPVWRAALIAAQRLHALKHEQERIDARDGVEQPDQSGIDGRRVCLCRHIAVQHGPMRRRCLTAGCDCKLFVARNRQP